MTAILTSLPLGTSFNQIGPVDEFLGFSWLVYLFASVALLTTFAALYYLLESDAMLFAGLVLFWLVGTVAG